jgi:hypothetical protein
MTARTEEIRFHFLLKEIARRLSEQRRSFDGFVISPFEPPWRRFRQIGALCLSRDYTTN